MRALRWRISVARRPLILVVAMVGLAATASLSSARPALAQGGTITPPTNVPPTKTSCVAQGTGTKCTGTFSGDHAFYQQIDPNPQPGVQSWYAAAPTVTVSQTQNLANQVIHVSWTNFTPSIDYASPTGTGFTAGSTEYAVAIYECLANPQRPAILGDYPGGAGSLNSDCYAITNQLNAPAGQANGIQTFTSPDGTGQADIQIETAVENSALGCSATKPCSLAVVPNWGGRQAPPDLSGQPDCTDHSWDEYAGSNNGNFGVSSNDLYLGYTCSWLDRIVVPLSFAPTPTQACSTKSYQFYSVGSPMLERAMKKWLPGWCQSSTSPLAFNYDSGVNEPIARQDFLNPSSALTANTDVAFTTLPANASETSGSNRKFTYAPLGVSGIAIAYYIDDPSTGQPLTNIKLDARLVAKLITQSYSLEYGTCPREAGGQLKQYFDCDPAVYGNPQTIFDDKEFLALNAPLKRTDFPADEGGSIPALGTFLPTVLQGTSDLTYELTRWIMSDPGAVSFLEGNRDPWGMVVNDNYRNEQLPTQQFLKFDAGYTPTIAQVLGDTNNINHQSATMDVSWNPVSGLDSVATTLIGDQSTAFNPDLVCISLITNNQPCVGTTGYELQKMSQQAVGQRGLFAIMDQGNAAAFRFPTAQLVNSAGVAVAPTVASMGAAVHDMRTNTDGITQYADFTNKDPKQYPLTMVDYAMVPTCGLTSAKANAISHFLTNVTSPTAQSYGPALGQLNGDGGYLTLNGNQLAETKKAASAVAKQACTSPPPDRTTGGVTPTGGSGGGPANNTSGGPTGSTTSPAGTAKTHGPTSSSTPSSRTEPVALGTKSPDSGVMAALTTTALIVGALLLVGGPAAYMYGQTEQGAAFYRRLRRYLARFFGRLTRLVGR